MLKRKKILLIICFAALCMSSAPVFADLFDVSVDRIDMTFDGTTFNAWLNKPYGSVTLNRIEAPIETVELEYVHVGGTATLGDFSLWMDLDNFTATTATATGEFTLTDIDGDTITGDITGNWGLIGGYTHFSGEMSDIQWTSDDGFFNGNDGSDDNAVPLDLITLPPWEGNIIDLTINYHEAWMLYTDWGGKTKIGTIDASVVPTPAAVLLGILGLGVVGIKLRKYA